MRAIKSTLIVGVGIFAIAGAALAIPDKNIFNSLRQSEKILIQNNSFACPLVPVYATPGQQSNNAQYFTFNKGDTSFPGFSCRQAGSFAAGPRLWYVQRIDRMKIPCQQPPHTGDCTVSVDRVCSASLKGRPNSPQYYGPCRKPALVGLGGCAICSLQELQIVVVPY